jgi:hypothetical protein
MKHLFPIVAAVGLFLLPTPAFATSFTWDGGAGTRNFGDADNWNPNGTTYTTADDFLIDEGAEVEVTDTFEIGSIDLAGSGESLTINNGATLSFANSTSGTLSFFTADSSLTVNGTLNAGGNRYDIQGNGGTFEMEINGSVIGMGNNGITDGANILVEVNRGGYYELGSRTAIGRTLGGVPRIFEFEINPGGTIRLFRDLELKAADPHTVAIRLNGGSLEMGFYHYTYPNLNTADNEDNGIIFDDSSSKITLAGDRVSEVNGWIADDALRSKVGALEVSYDSSNDVTTVTP